MLQQLPNLVTCLALCFFAWGFFNAYLRRKGVGYTRYYMVTVVYFTATAGIIAFVFLEHLVPILQDFNVTPLLMLGIFMLIQAAWYAYFPTFFRPPTLYFESYPDRHYLEISLRRLLSKSTDIAAQQVFIVLLVVFLRDAGLSVPGIIAAFFMLFALLHTPLLVLEWRRWPWFAFAGAILLFSIVFPVLILLVPYGFVYNIILHWLFYTTTSAVFWLRCAERLPNAQEKIKTLLAQWSARLVPVGIGAASYFFIQQNLPAAGVTLLTVVLIMEMRVRLGYRTTRGATFYTHVSSGTLLLGLVLYGIVSETSLHTGVLLALTLIMSVTGFALLWRSRVLHGY